MMCRLDIRGQRLVAFHGPKRWFRDAEFRRMRHPLSGNPMPLQGQRLRPALFGQPRIQDTRLRMAGL